MARFRAEAAALGEFIVRFMVVTCVRSRNGEIFQGTLCLVEWEMRWRKVVPIGGPGPDYYRPFIL